MPDLDKLISKILSDCEKQSNSIVDGANKKAAEIIAESEVEANKESERILAGATLEAERAAERLLAGKRLEIRDEHLEAKRQVIDKVFKLALERLNNMPKEKFREFLQKALLNMDLSGSEIVLPAKYGLNISELSSLLKGNKAVGEMKLCSEREASSGFILVKEGVESNNTFETLLDYYRDELETEIIAKLF